MSAHNVHHMHQNSLAAYRDLVLQPRHAEILAAVRRHGPMTDRTIGSRLGYVELNAVRPRVTELLQAGHLAELESTRCPVTGKTVRVVALPVSGVAA